jgi:hypothetical protein
LSVVGAGSEGSEPNHDSRVITPSPETAKIALALAMMRTNCPWESAAIRMLFDNLVTGGMIEHNPALSVKAPRQKLGKGKTRMLTAAEMRAKVNTITPIRARSRSPPTVWSRWSAAARPPPRLSA